MNQMVQTQFSSLRVFMTLWRFGDLKVPQIQFVLEDFTDSSVCRFRDVAIFQHHLLKSSLTFERNWPLRQEVVDY